MDTLHFGFAVAAFGTIDDIRETLESIGAQDVDAQTNMSVVVAHHDETVTEESVRAALGDTLTDVRLLAIEPHENVDVMRCGAMPALADAMPENLDWVWVLEDGHRLYARSSLQQLANTIREDTHSQVHMIHVCDVNKSFDTGHIQINTVTELCETFGFSEILGSPSCLVMRPSHFKFAHGAHLAETAERARDGEIWVTPHTCAQFVYLAMAENDSLLVDLKLVDLESSGSNVETRTGEDWFRLTRELIELGNAMGMDTKWDPHFFRHGDSSLWIELVRQQGLAVDSFTPEMDEASESVVRFIENWQVLLHLADCVRNDEAKTIIQNVVTNGVKLTLDFLRDEAKDTTRLKAFFAEQIKDARTYPSTLYRADYLMRLLKQSA